MEPDGDVKDAGEALLAALAGHSLSAPPSALRDRVIRGALRRERRPVSWWPRPAVIGGAVALVVLLAGALAWGTHFISTHN